MFTEWVRIQWKDQVYTTIQKFGVGKIIFFFFLVFERSLSCSTWLDLFDPKHSENSNIVKY